MIWEFVRIFFDIAKVPCMYALELTAMRNATISRPVLQWEVGNPSGELLPTSACMFSLDNTFWLSD